MIAILEAESTLTDRYQTTVPESIRRALGLGKRDKVHYTVRPNGEVVLSRADVTDQDDPALAPFLTLLAGDIERNPQNLRLIDQALLQDARALVEGVEIDLDAPLADDEE